MTTPSVQRVLAYLETITDPRIELVIRGYQGDEERPLRVDDLVDLIRQAVLLDSMAAEIDRQGQEIARLRAQLPDEPGIIDYGPGQ